MTPPLPAPADPAADAPPRAHPIDTVRWLPREVLVANTWNPNHVAPPELDLLRRSITEDGWTTAIVVAANDPPGTFEIIDGFHRWTVAGEPEIAALTDGLVPVVVVALDPAHARISTIRHNRARGVHHVARMADLVSVLVNDLGLPPEEIEARLGMEPEEVRRLLEHGDVLARIGTEEMGEAWRPAPAAPAAPASAG